MSNEHEVAQMFMQNVVRQIHYLDLEELETILKDSRESRQQWDAIGSLVDPTSYRDMLFDGTREHAEVQDEILIHLIGIRKCIDKLNALTAQYKQAHGEDSQSREKE